MESFAGESFEIVELDNALSYWEFIGASDVADSDYEFEVRSFDDGVSSLRSSISGSSSLSQSFDQSIDLAGPIESEEEDQGLDSGDLGDIGVEAEIVVHEALGSRFEAQIEPEDEDLGVDSGVCTESVVNEVLRSQFAGTIEPEEEDLGVDSGVCAESVVNEVLRSQFAGKIEPEEEDLGVDSGVYTESVVNEVPRSRFSDKIEPQEEDCGVDSGVYGESMVSVHSCDGDWQAHRYSCEWRYRSCNCHEDSDEEPDEDLDDELMPWSVAGKFGRQRIRKMGKRTSVKTSSSKLLARVKPGCVRGKHGLGVKHSF